MEFTEANLVKAIQDKMHGSITLHIADGVVLRAEVKTLAQPPTEHKSTKGLTR